MRFVFLLIWSSIVLCDSKKRYDGHHLVRIQPTSKEQHTHIIRTRQTHPEFEIWTDSRSGEDFHVRVPPQHLPAFQSSMKNLNIPSRTVSSDLQRIIDKEAARDREARANKTDSDIVGIIATSAEIEQWLAKKCDESPIATCLDIGKSYEGRPLRMIRINSDGSDQKPAIFFDCGLHAREWLSPATCIWIINKVLRDYKSDDQLKELVDTFDWYILPSANPDGYQYSIDEDRFWRKTRSKTNTSGCIGVDANRNFDMEWDSPGGSSGDPCNLWQVYRGQAPFSENETKATSDFQMTLSGRYVLYMAVHSFGRMFFIPWGWTKTSKPKKYNEMLRVASIGAEAMRQQSGQAWRVGSTGDLLNYAVSGNSQDWAHAKANATYSYAIELSPGQGGEESWLITDGLGIERSGQEFYAGLTAILREVKRTLPQRHTYPAPITSQTGTTLSQAPTKYSTPNPFKARTTTSLERLTTSSARTMYPQPNSTLLPPPSDLSQLPGQMHTNLIKSLKEFNLARCCRLEKLPYLTCCQLTLTPRMAYCNFQYIAPMWGGVVDLVADYKTIDCTIEIIY